ncbi:unnamed protein product, partial [marine sediment metagenome]
AVALFHAVGVTPEANTLEEAFQGSKPERVIDIHLSDLIKSRSDLSTAEEGANLDLVVLGCPHFSFDEFRELAELIQAQTEKGKILHPGVKFVVISCQTSYALLQRSEFAGAAGGNNPVYFPFSQKKPEVLPERHLIYLIILGKGCAKYGIYSLKFFRHNLLQYFLIYLPMC